ncbi:phage tail assembly chaperone [Shimia sp. Alg240-R146]|uniref:phage tail assembly chaperone n=1 Tax=Shimia sp. Alg240-R146 TaxID=2993449 RepID=UPI0022E8A223|nr:phage tail assembly chaperone [Shimia sp. Alg240-R146]
MSGFDWGSLLGCAMRQCRLCPEEFWALTPVEFGVLVGANGSGAALSRDRFQALMTAFPDKTDMEGSGDG